MREGCENRVLKISILINVNWGYREGVFCIVPKQQVSLILTNLEEKPLKFSSHSHRSNTLNEAGDMNVLITVRSDNDNTCICLLEKGCKN